MLFGDMDMSTIETVSTGWQRLVSNVAASSDNGITPMSDWFPAGSISALRCAYQLKSRTGTIEVIPAIEMANDIRGSSTVTNLGTTWGSSEGYIDPGETTSVATAAAGKQWARLGFVTRNTTGSGSGLSTCEVAPKFEISFLDYDSVVLGWMTIVANSMTPNFFPRTGWLAAADASNLRVSFEARGLTGNMSVEPGYQLANDPASPDSATAMGGARTSDGISYPSAWTAPSVGGKQLIRLGWVIKNTSGSAASWAVVTGRAEMTAQ